MGISYAEYKAMLRQNEANEPGAEKPTKLPRAKRAPARPPGPFMRKYRQMTQVEPGTPARQPKQTFREWKCLAIDPSITRLGFHVVTSDGSELENVETGVWAPSGAEHAPDRWQQIACFTTELLRHFNPTDVVVEMPHAHQSEGRGGQKRGFKSLMIYSVGVGMVAGVIASQKRRLWRPDANQWKGTSKKYDTLTFVELTMGLKGLSADEADAAGLAWWWYQYILPSLATTTPLTFRPPF